MRPFVLLVSAILSFSPAARAADPLEPIDVALGEWPPFVSESIDGYGEVAERVTAVLERMGYRPNYIFMPWGQAETTVRDNETNVGPRVTFPYLKTQKRDRQSKLSGQPVLETCMKFFYNRKKMKGPRPPSISRVEDLLMFGAAYVSEDAGYQYPDKDPENLTAVLEKRGTKANSLYEAFKWLVSEDATHMGIQYVPAAGRVGEEMLVELFPEERFDIGQIEEKGVGKNKCLLRVKYFVMLSNRNPDNEEFAKRFDATLINFYRLKVSAQIDARAIKRPSLRHPRVVLHAAGGAAAILGRDSDGQFYALPRGTRGLLMDWRPAAESTPLKARAKVRITNGPYWGKELEIDGSHVTLE
jgi:hypothetical protein